MLSRSRWAVAALVGVLAVASPALAGGSDEQTPVPAPDDPRAGLSEREFERQVRRQQTSDGLPGEIAAPIPAVFRGRPIVTDERSWVVAPGVVFSRWDETNARGTMRAYLLRTDLAESTTTIDYASNRFVPGRDTTKAILARDEAVAGVNGGFFDITDTGAPLGVGRDRDRGTLHAAQGSWDQAFWLGSNGVPDIGTLHLAAAITEHPGLAITNVNSPTVRDHGIGVYTRRWGRTPGYAVTDGKQRNRRMVVVQEGVVTENKRRLTKGDRIRRGVVLIGRGDGAKRLRRLDVGTRATVTWSLEGDPPVAISGGRVLLEEREVMVSDDRTLHPRTAVGIDRDLNQILMLVVDGRQDFSRGYTVVELARLMRRLGAEDALNLDGGGSSTMVATGRGGRVKVMNSPSDGSARLVPDALQITYQPITP